MSLIVKHLSMAKLKENTMNVERADFYTNYRNRFDHSLTQKQVDGYEAIFNYWDGSSLNDFRWLAYALATAYHETGRRIEPVREGFTV